ncbi:DUF6790 family protein [Microlunatus ginsengisoli]|uniref:DUF4386 family protein n=1 Tax=Microlunatus ginsengisoli TaxID=363863 RepID=A0ABP6ZWW6_9ACTN
MIGSLIAALIGNYMTTCFAIGLIVGLVAVARHRGPRTPESSSGLLLNAYVLWAIGVAQAINFVMHSVFGDFAAASIGWAQSPFQLELAFSSLGVAVMAFILHGRHAPFRGKVAVVIATAIFGYGAAAGHVYQVIANHDYAVNNTGLLLVMDVAIPTVGLALVVWHAVSPRTGATDAGGASSASGTDAVTRPEPAGRR